MAIAWPAVLRNVPWGQVIARYLRWLITPKGCGVWLLKSLRHRRLLLQTRSHMPHRNHKRWPHSRCSSSCIEAAMADSRGQTLASSELIKELVEQNAQLIQRIETYRVRIFGSGLRPHWSQSLRYSWHYRGRGTWLVRSVTWNVKRVLMRRFLFVAVILHAGYSCFNSLHGTAVQSEPSSSAHAVVSNQNTNQSNATIESAFSNRKAAFRFRVKELLSSCWRTTTTAAGTKNLLSNGRQGALC